MVWCRSFGWGVDGGSEDVVATTVGGTNAVQVDDDVDSIIVTYNNSNAICDILGAMEVLIGIIICDP